MNKDFINILDFSAAELEGMLSLAAKLKARKQAGIVETIMQGKVMGMYFQKDSLRTRVSLEVAMASMGGSSIYFDFRGQPMFARESLSDQARVMGRLVDIIAMRTFSHDEVEEFARWSKAPVINGLSDWSHPTQVMADILTMREHLGDTRGKELVYVGDGNNVVHSLVAICARLGIKCTLACPRGYQVGDDFLRKTRAACPGAELRELEDPFEAVKNADAIYTDVWVSMGKESEAAERRRTFQRYQVNRELLNAAPKGAIVLHCLPAHRGDEITDEIMDDPEISAVFDEAENRMHVLRAIIATLAGTITDKALLS